MRILDHQSTQKWFDLSMMKKGRMEIREAKAMKEPFRAILKKVQWLAFAQLLRNERDTQEKMNFLGIGLGKLKVNLSC